MSTVTTKTNYHLRNSSETSLISVNTSKEAYNRLSPLPAKFERIPIMYTSNVSFSSKVTDDLSTERNLTPRQDISKHKNSSKEQKSSMSKINTLKRCDFCRMEISPELVFTNQYCYHNFCLYCLEDNPQGTSDRCLSKNCPIKLDHVKVNEFCQRKGHDEAPKLDTKTQQNQIQDATSKAYPNIPAPKLDLNHQTILKSLMDKNEHLLRANNQLKEQIVLEETKTKQQCKLNDDLSSEMKCSICLNYIYHCVTVLPCLHNFCAGCLSDYMQKSSSSPRLCPLCKQEALIVKKER